MEKKRSIIVPLGIFMLFFLSIFLLREINFTGRSTGIILIGNNPPQVTTNPVINDTAPNTNSHILCIPGDYFDADGHIKVRDYFKWFKNNQPLLQQVTANLDLSAPFNGDATNTIICQQRTNDGYSNSTWRNSTSVTIISLQTTTTIGGGGGGSTTTICYPSYVCTQWSSCIDGKQTRECTDLNDCQQPSVRTDTRSCLTSQIPGAVETTVIEQKPEEIIQNYSILSIVLISLALLLFIILAVIATVLSRKRVKPKQKAKESLLRSDLTSYVRQALDHGYNKEQIEEALLKAGWPQYMIDAAFREVT